jgi:hypothetical protein
VALVTLSPWVLPRDAERVRVHAPRYRPWVAIGLLALVAGIPLLIALVADEPGFRLFMAALGLLLLVGIPISVAWMQALPVGAVQVQTDAVGLRFAPSAALHVTSLVAAALGVLVGALPYVLGAFGVSSISGVSVRFSPFVIGVLALGWLVYQLVGLRDPAGLTLTPAGLRGVRGGSHVDLAWDDLESVEVRPGRRGARLLLNARSGAGVEIDPHWTGSDPNLVGAIVARFHAHPADRGALVEGRAAIRRVEDAVNPTV